MRVSFALWAVTTVVALGLSSCGGDDSMKFDADKYRAEIEKIEGILTQAEPQPNDASKLHIYASELAGAMGKDMQNHMQREYIMNRLISFGESYAQLEDQGIPWDIQAAREEWKTVRGNLFRDASWFQSM